MKRIAFISVFLLLFLYYCKAESVYFNSLNEFGELGKTICAHKYRNISQANENLIDENISTDIAYNIYSHNLKDTDYSFEICLANMNSDEGKNYTVFEPSSDKKKRIIEPTWGVVWNYIDTNNHYKVQLQYKNSNLYDMFDERSMNVKITRIIGGKEHTILEKSVKEFVNLYGEMNVIAIKHGSSTTTIQIGNKTIRTVASIDNDNLPIEQNGGVGYFVGSGAKVAVNRAMLEFNERIATQLYTNWTIPSLDTHFAASKDIYEGYWEYLDRNLNEDKLRLGGKYRIALIKTVSGYDIIYLSGAKVNESNWNAGMLKARLTSTSFVDTYNLVWYDALMSPFTVDVYAKFVDNTILEFHFPIQNSVLRFCQGKNIATP